MMRDLILLVIIVNYLNVISGFPEKNLTQNLSEFEESLDVIEGGEFLISLGHIGKVIILTLATVWAVSFIIVPAILYLMSGALVDSYGPLPQTDVSEVNQKGANSKLQCVCGSKNTLVNYVSIGLLIGIPIGIIVGSVTWFYL